MGIEQSAILDLLAHELKNSIAVIKLMSENAEFSKDLKAEEYRRTFRIISEQADSMTELAEYLSIISKMRNSDIELEYKEQDIARVVGEAVQSVRAIGEKKDVAINMETEEGCKAVVNLDSLKIAIKNIAANSIKYTESCKNIYVRVKTESRYVIIEVEDEGFGISQEDIGRIFERSYRASDEKVRAQKGSGLGLAAAKRIIEQLHRGIIEAESQLDRGSLFRVKLPIEKKNM